MCFQVPRARDWPRAPFAHRGAAFGVPGGALRLRWGPRLRRRDPPHAEDPPREAAASIASLCLCFSTFLSFRLRASQLSVSHISFKIDFLSELHFFFFFLLYWDRLRFFSIRKPSMTSSCLSFTIIVPSLCSYMAIYLRVL